MKDTIRQIVRYMIQNPVCKSVITEELNNYENSNQVQFSDNETNCKIKIDHNNRIILMDYGSELQIAGYQAKSLYIFYLLIPYNVSNEQLLRYESILIAIYKEVCDYKICDDYRAVNVIQGMLMRDGGISDATNKIRKALKKVIDEEQLIKQYAIEGSRNKERHILLPKQSVLIESTALSAIKEQILRFDTNQ